jgi:hypothetical protein
VTKPFAWSYSALTSFETCPKRHYHLRIAKDVREAPSEAQNYGLGVHKAFELRIRHGATLPVHLQKFEGLCQKITEWNGEIQAEVEWAVNSSWAPTAWFAKDTWLRVKADLLGTAAPRALIVDWKTGKVQDDDAQMRLNAMMGFVQLPDVDEFVTLFAYTKHDVLSKPVRHHRQDLPRLMEEFRPRVERFEKAYYAYDFPPRPNGLCRRHCPVSSCPHNGN